MCPWLGTVILRAIDCRINYVTRTHRMHFMLVAVGSIGDVFPYFGIGEVLRGRGHRVFIVASPYYEDQIRELGLEFMALGTSEQHQDLLSHPDAWHPRKGWILWLRMGGLDLMEELYDVVKQNYAEGETIVVGSWAAVGARVAQEKLGVPMATLHIEPDRFRSIYDTAFLPRHTLIRNSNPLWLKRFQFWYCDVIVDQALAPLSKFRRRLGLPAHRRFIRDWFHSPQLSLGLFPDWWAPPQADWPKQTVLTGYPLWDKSENDQLPSDVADFVSGEKPIVFTPGALNQHAGKFFEESAAVCCEKKLKAVFITMHPEQLPSSLPDSVRHWSYVPFRPLLRETALAVHHGGTGTTWQCLAAGVPQIVMPLMHLHEDTAQRLKRLGTGETILPGKFNGRTLAAAIDRITSSVEIRSNCEAVQNRVRGSDPHQTICDALEKLL
ncbi:MAG: nucleotide disphospho-sugar-binding domain-containing protein [Fuerstiella sp.]